MTRKKKPLPLIEGVTITGIAAEGKAMVRINDMVVFVPFVVPGDVVDLQITRKKHNYAEGVAVQLVKASPLRVAPRCAHFGVCGGCRWQQLPYEEQLKAKHQQVMDQLTRIGKVELHGVRSILDSKKIWEYRNKLEFGCANKRWKTAAEIATGAVCEDYGAVGFHIAGAFDKILAIEKCYLMDDLHNTIRNDIRDYALENGITLFDLRAQHGLLRDIIIRNSATGQWMVIIQFHYDEEGDEQQAAALMEHIATTFPQVTALMSVNNQKCNDTIGDQEVVVYKGDDHIIETMENLRFKVGPKSFYQTNTCQAQVLYSVAREFASLSGSEIVYDLYTGTGTIACFVARQAAKVVGIEYVPEAIEDAKVNAQLNGITNTAFFAGDMKDILNDTFIAAHGRPDVIITDPPRAGMHADVVATILRAAPKRIVYVSCNPATQARDIALLSVQYTVAAVQPVDMFPHTPHVENVVLLTKNEA